MLAVWSRGWIGSSRFFATKPIATASIWPLWTKSSNSVKASTERCSLINSSGLYSFIIRSFSLTNTGHSLGRIFRWPSMMPSWFSLRNIKNFYSRWKIEPISVPSSPFRHIRFVSFCLFSFGHLFYLYIFSLKSLVHTCNLTQFFPLTIEKFIR